MADLLWNPSFKSKFDFESLSLLVHSKQLGILSLQFGIGLLGLHFLSIII
jgi:hypothetical protein